MEPCGEFNLGLRLGLICYQDMKSSVSKCTQLNPPLSLVKLGNAGFHYNEHLFLKIMEHIGIAKGGNVKREERFGLFPLYYAGGGLSGRWEVLPKTVDHFYVYLQFRMQFLKVHVGSHCTTHV